MYVLLLRIAFTQSEFRVQVWSREQQGGQMGEFYPIFLGQFLKNTEIALNLGLLFHVLTLTKNGLGYIFSQTNLVTLVGKH
jgi:hypothetical protein